VQGFYILEDSGKKIHLDFKYLIRDED